jgi:hypothetical protein
MGKFLYYFDIYKGMHILKGVVWEDGAFRFLKFPVFWRDIRI